MSEYETIITQGGLAAEAKALSDGVGFRLTHFGVGSGTDHPDSAQTALQAEVYRAEISSLKIDPANANRCEAECVLPSSVGGWEISEIGLFMDDGTLYAIANVPTSYKAAISHGVGHDLKFNVIFQVVNASEVTLLVDPSVIMATQRYADIAAAQAVAHHEAAGTHPDATETTPGFIRLATIDETLAGTSREFAIHPVGLKAAIDALVAGAPGALDTLNELAAALGDNPNFAAMISSELAARAPLVSPALQGVPTVPTATPGTKTEQAASTAFVGTAIAEYDAATSRPYDIPFIAGFGPEMKGEDLALRQYGSVYGPRDILIRPSHVAAICEIPPTGDAVIFDIRIDWKSVFQTPPRINPGGQLAEPGLGVEDVVTFRKGSLLTFHVTQVGSEIRGQRLSVTIPGLV